jgi:hypothetical protein
MVIASTTIAGIATALGAGVIGAGAGMLLSGGRGSGSAPQPAPMPEAPKVSDAAGKAESEAQKRAKRAQSYQSVYTSPLGLGTQADVAKKSLLGQ